MDSARIPQDRPVKTTVSQEEITAPEMTVALLSRVRRLLDVSHLRRRRGLVLREPWSRFRAGRPDRASLGLAVGEKGED